MPTAGDESAVSAVSAMSHAILSRLVDLSKAAKAAREAGNQDAANDAERLLDGARGYLSDSLKRATVRKRPMYDNPDELAVKVIEKLKRGPYKQIEGRSGLGSAVSHFLTDTSVGRSACEYGPLCIWDVSTFVMFDRACETGDDEPPFNSDLYWNTSSAVSMRGTFSNNTEFEGDLSTWDVSKVKDMFVMFHNSGIKNSGIGRWNTASLEQAYAMFQNAKFIDRDLNLAGWETGKCTEMKGMFWGSAIVDSNIGKWNVEKADVTNMLRDTRFKGDLSGWSSGQKAIAIQGVLS
jgi:hypothetical protein